MISNALNYSPAQYNTFFGGALVTALAISNPKSSVLGKALSLITGLGLSFRLPKEGYLRTAYNCASWTLGALNYFYNPSQYSNTLEGGETFSTELLHGIARGTLATTTSVVLGGKLLWGNEISKKDLPISILGMGSVFAGPFILNEAIRHYNNETLSFNNTQYNTATITSIYLLNHLLNK